MQKCTKNRKNYTLTEQKMIIFETLVSVPKNGVSAPMNFYFFVAGDPNDNLYKKTFPNL
jgi:hypothetical protein